MKIEFDLPEWAVGRNINIMAGAELLAKIQFIREKNRDEKGELRVKEYYQPIKIKLVDGRCNGCGDCCSQGGSPFPQRMLAEITYRLDNYTYNKSGKCPLLGKDGCIMRGSIPFSCLKSNCEDWSKNCSEKLISIEDIKVI